MKETFYAINREQWRNWLSANFETKQEIWFIFPSLSSGEESLSYNDAVEEALCFGWIDGRAGTLDEKHSIRRFTPRRKGSSYSRPNIERLIWLESQDLIHPKIRNEVLPIITKEYSFPKDIIDEIKKDKIAYENFCNFTLPYRRIRVSYIDSSRNRRDEFSKRLGNFINKTRENKLITGYGGIDKYYK